MTPRRIGVLGGMGPQATVLLMQKVIAATPAQDDGDHVPLIVDQNPQVPSRIRHLIEGQGEDPGPVLAAMARRLQVAGAEALAMPCNTAHHYADAIRAAVTVPLIDMVALSVARAGRMAGQGGQIGILASPAVKQIGLFDGPCAAAGLTPVYPRDQDALLGAIRAIKAGRVQAEVRLALRRASEDLLKQGARVQMIACTEFSTIADDVAGGADVFDTLDELVGGMIAFATRGAADPDRADAPPPTPGAKTP